MKFSDLAGNARNAVLAGLIGAGVREQKYRETFISPPGSPQGISGGWREGVLER